SPTGRISCKPTAGSSLISKDPEPSPHPFLARQVLILRAQVSDGAITEADLGLRAIRIPGQLHNESVAPVHIASGCHIVADGWRSSRRYRGLPAALGFSFAGSGLPNHSGDDLLSWRRSDGHGIVRNRASGAPAWTGTGPQPNDVQQFAGQLDHYSAVQPRPKYRRCRTEIGRASCRERMEYNAG